MDLPALKDRLRQEVEARATTLLEVSHRIHAHPEVNFEEHFAHDLLTQTIADEGLSVERGAFGLPTAFVARAGVSGPTVAVLCEYDALPGIGHACGHNIIAAAGLGAGLAASALAEEAGGRVVILGTPAEEGGGGKIKMLQRGALEGVDAAMMVHPAGAELTRMDTIAVQELAVTYRGEASHAAAFPHRGRNALDAAVIGYQAVGALRQHILPTERIHGIFTIGGDKPNVVPATARTEWMVRSPTIGSLEPLKGRVEAALRAGALATGCEVEVAWKDVVYADVIDNDALARAYAANATALGRAIAAPTISSAVMGSTDMGNVSYAVPAIHPMIQAAPDGLAIHTPDFAEHAAGEMGDKAVVDGALAMAWTVADLWLDEAFLDDVRAEFAAALIAVGEGARRSAIGGSTPT